MAGGNKEMNHLPENELNTPVSYYLLYQHINKSNRDNSHEVVVDEYASNQEETNEMEKLKSDQNRNNHSFWRVDEWNDSEREEVFQILQENESKCSVPLHRILQYEKRASKYWDTFYEHHGTNFFKDRHYLSKAFPEEFGGDANCSSKCLVEIGSGVGNNILPLLEEYPHWKFWGYDLSPVAIDIMKQDTRFDTSRATGGVWDISKDNDDDTPVKNLADICTLLFCLSAISPEKMTIAAHNIASTLQPGGILIMRDYGRYDEAQLKLGSSRAKRLGDNFYVKSDGTRCYYFCLEDIENLFVQQAGLELLELKYVTRIYQNRATEEQRRRVWVQGRFRKPLISSTNLVH